MEFSIHMVVLVLSQHLIQGSCGNTYIRLVLAWVKSYRHHLLSGQSYGILAGVGLVWGWLWGGFRVFGRVTSDGVFRL